MGMTPYQPTDVDLKAEPRRSYLDTNWVVLYPFLPLLRRRWGRWLLATLFVAFFLAYSVKTLLQ